MAVLLHTFYFQAHADRALTVVVLLPVRAVDLGKSSVAPGTAFLAMGSAVEPDTTATPANSVTTQATFAATQAILCVA